jgi:2-polyprenyl-6-methoxyphenol hydroxylase-like FAD-dependent oxidoreductase
MARAVAAALMRRRRSAVPLVPLEEIQEVYDQRAAIPARFHDMTWSSWFSINSRMVHYLKMGNLLLGGDAAHIHAPAGAQGMNTGMQDMINLCWKLALHIQGKAPLELLETYGPERIPIIQDVLRGTERINDMIGAQDHAFREAATLLRQVAATFCSIQGIQHGARRPDDPHRLIGLRASGRITDWRRFWLTNCRHSTLPCRI